VTPDLLGASVQLAVDSGVHWHMHCSESADEVEFFETLYAQRPVEWLEQEGLLSSATTLAHAIWLDPDEVDLMGHRRATAVHNPISNQYLASGVIQLEALQARGANVALGSDGIAVAGQDMFEAMKAGTLTHRVAGLDPAAATVEQFLEIAALGGASMTEVNGGSLAAGLVADVVVLDVDKVRHAPWNRPVASVVHSGRSSDVDTVVVAGEIIVQGGASTRIDQDEVIAHAGEAAARLFGEADLTALVKDW
jgi:5-methylthioadenosine/S-adenosylhomocysteine deaminase